MSLARASTHWRWRPWLLSDCLSCCKFQKNSCCVLSTRVATLKFFLGTADKLKLFHNLHGVMTPKERVSLGSVHTHAGACSCTMIHNTGSTPKIWYVEFHARYLLICDYSQKVHNENKAIILAELIASTLLWLLEESTTTFVEYMNYGYMNDNTEVFWIRQISSGQKPLF